MADDLEFLAVELASSASILHEQLRLKTKEVAELSAKYSKSMNDIESLNCSISSLKSENQGLQVQVQVRSEATIRLEADNSKLRDTVAKLLVSTGSDSTERQQLLQRCQLAEEDRMNWMKKYEDAKKTESEHVAFKTQCCLLQNQIRTTVNQIVTHQESLQKEYVKIERSVQDVKQFAKAMSSHLTVESIQLSNAIKAREELQQKVVNLSVELSAAQNELAELKNNKSDRSGSISVNGNYITEWTAYQEHTNKRLEWFMKETQRLQELLELTQKQIDSEQKLKGQDNVDT